MVVNAEKVRVSGKKATDKMYHHHTGYMGNMRSFSFQKMIERAPQDIITLAVKGMLPKNPLGRAMLAKLKVYAGPTHNHQAQQPQALDI